MNIASRITVFLPFAVTTAIAFTALPGCGDAAPVDPELGEAESAMTVCAAGATIEGIDVSKWQADIDWAAVGQSGIEFAIARVAYGTSKDTYFDANWSGMASAGLVRGAYQYFLPAQDAIAQADLVLSTIGALGPGDLPPVIDVEDNGGLSAPAVASKVQQWVTHVEAAIGRKPIIYTGKYFWQDYVQSGAFGSYPLWIPNYSFNCPNLPDGYWNDWHFFQYTDSGSVPGIAGAVDLDKFNGSVQDLLNFAGGGTGGVGFWAAEFVSQSFPYVSQGNLTMYAGDAVEVTLEMRNTGSQAWDSNTRLATTEPRDRASVFAGPEWPAPNRYAQVTGTVPPGGTYQFKFTLHAPQQPGIYDEHMGLVQEGVTWFSDPGQGGPPDAQLEGQFEVLPAIGGSGGSAGAAGVGGGAGTTTGGWGEGGDNGNPDDVTMNGHCAFTAPARSSAWQGVCVLLGVGWLWGHRARSRTASMRGRRSRHGWCFWSRGGAQACDDPSILIRPMWGSIGDSPASASCDQSRLRRIPPWIQPPDRALVAPVLARLVRMRVGHRAPCAHVRHPCAHGIQSAA